MLKGYRLSGEDNDSFMLAGETRKSISDEEKKFFDWRFTLNGSQHPATCRTCGSKTDPNYINPLFKLTKTRLDLSSTYDGYTIVTERFKKFLTSKNVNDVKFFSLPSQPKHYCLQVNKIINIDVEASQGIRFLNYCVRCKKFTGVFGTSRLIYKELNDSPLNGIYRTDIEFAQAHQQHPLLIVSRELGDAIKLEHFKGISLKKINL